MTVREKSHMKLFLRQLNLETDRQERGRIIYHELRRRNLNWSKIGRQMGVSCNGVKYAVYDRDKSERVQTYVAAILGVPKETLWPLRYRADDCAA